MECFATIANNFYPLVIAARPSILDICGNPGYVFAIPQIDLLLLLTYTITENLTSKSPYFESQNM